MAINQNAWLAQNRPSYDPNNVMMMDFLKGEIPFEQATSLLREIKNESALLRFAKAEPMTTPVKEYRKLGGLEDAYWVAETERIRTSKSSVSTRYMYSFKLGVIVECSNETLQYSMADFFNVMREEIAEKFRRKLDQATLLGINNPWDSVGQPSLVEAADEAGNLFYESDNKYDDLNKAIGAIEAGDYDATGIVTSRKQKQIYRGTKDTVGRPIFNEATKDAPADLLGIPTIYLPKGVINNGIAEIVADWDYVKYGILQNITYKISDDASVTTHEVTDPVHADPTSPNTNTVNAFERDMWLMRATMQIGFMIEEPEAVSVIMKADENGGDPGTQGTEPVAGKAAASKAKAE